MLIGPKMGLSSWRGKEKKKKRKLNEMDELWEQTLYSVCPLGFVTPIINIRALTANDKRCKHQILVVVFYYNDKIIDNLV